MTTKPPKPKLPCETHEPHPHTHTPGRKCSERYWCTKCERWYDGPQCKPRAA